MQNFNNKNQIRLFSACMSLCLLVLVAILLLQPTYWGHSWLFRPFFVSLVGLQLATVWLVQPYYLEMSIKGKILEIRYWHLLSGAIFFPKRKMIQIHRNDFEGFEIVAHNYGISTVLMLRVRNYLQLLWYPPIGITLSRKKDLKIFLIEFQKSTH